MSLFCPLSPPVSVLSPLSLTCLCLSLSFTYPAGPLPVTNPWGFSVPLLAMTRHGATLSHCTSVPVAGHTCLGRTTDSVGTRVPRWETGAQEVEGSGLDRSSFATGPSARSTAHPHRVWRPQSPGTEGRATIRVVPTRLGPVPGVVLSSTSLVSGGATCGPDTGTTPLSTDGAPKDRHWVCGVSQSRSDRYHCSEGPTLVTTLPVRAKGRKLLLRGYVFLPAERNEWDTGVSGAGVWVCRDSGRAGAGTSFGLWRPLGGALGRGLGRGLGEGPRGGASGGALGGVLGRGLGGVGEVAAPETKAPKEGKQALLSPVHVPRKVC